ncbi:MAG: cytochrome bc complex cytochrome b subunit [Nitrososphaerota archaeon]|nr:cytochrome bc complex cytochrome b subunit [Nitrososphaerota archaeon]
MEQEKKFLDKFTEFIESRVGLSKNILKPVPEYSLHPIYRLGTLIVIALLLQGFTGILMLPYYTPSPDKAYESTINIASNVPFGSLIQTMHLYTAYAMILLAFTHLARTYFVAAYKKPRELMWFIGMLMGLTILGSALTGHLLPWTVTSKLATDTSVNLIATIVRTVPSLEFIINFMIGTGSDEELLLRFFAFHIAIFPATLLTLLIMKVYLLEVHGVSRPFKIESERLVPWFPHFFIYLIMISSSFLAMILIVSILFPITFTTKFSPEIVDQYKPVPEWYLLWLHQIFKIEVFEKGGLYTAVVLLSIIFTLFFFLPFIDLSPSRNPMERPAWTTIGVLIIVELITLTILGYVKLDITISNIEATLFLGGSAILTIITSHLLFKRVRYEREVFGSTYIPTNQPRSFTRLWKDVMIFNANLILGAYLLATVFNFIPLLI